MPTLRLALLLPCFLATTAYAQLPPGKDGYTFPAGGKAGTVVEAKLAGSDWTPDVQFFVYDPRVKLEVLGPPSEVLVPEPPFWFGIKSFSNDPRLPREVPVRLHLPADLPVGPLRWGVANANGAGTGGVFLVSKGMEITEDEARTTAQDLPSLPVTVNGRLRRIEEVDRYRFLAASTGLVTCELFAQRLGNEMNGVLEVYSGETKIAEACDTEGVDPTLTFAVEKGKTYTLTLHDLEYRGYRNFTYRLEFTTGPRLLTANPPVGKPGEKRTIEFVGLGIATGKPVLERIAKEVTFPTQPTGTTFEQKLDTPMGSTNAFAFQLVEKDDTPEPKSHELAARKVQAPTTISGRLDKRGERDAYTFSGKKGELWEIAVEAKKVGSPIDATLTLFTSAGKQLATKDFYTTGADPRVLATLPADDEYLVLVSDASGKQPGLDAIYRLSLQKQVCRYSLKTTGIVNLPIGGKAALKVDVEREGGCKAPIALTFTGLPAGVTVPKELTIPATAVTLSVPLDCEATTGATAALVQLSGTATIDDKPMTVPARIMLGEEAVSSILFATTMKPPFKVMSPEADGTRKAPRGATHLADLIIERTAGFTGELTLDMAGAQSRHRQGIRGPVFTVKPDQKKVLYPVTVPEWLESTRTSRIALVAMTKLPDPKGTPRWVMAAMEGQVTMSIEGALLKLTHAAEGLQAEPGANIEVSLKLSRSPGLTGPVQVELIVPAALQGLVSAPTLAWPNEKSVSAWSITSKADGRLVGTQKLLARATGVREGHPVVAETEIEIEFVKK